MVNAPTDRRKFLSLAGAGLATFAASPWLDAAVPPQQAAFDINLREADLIVTNARVYTVDDRHPTAEAFAVKDGRFIAVGTNAEIKGLATKRTEVYDAKQMTIVPGFIDTHNHGGGELLLYNVIVGNPYDVEFFTIRSIQDKLAARVRVTPPGTWVNGYFYDDTKIKDGRPVTRQDLDEVSTEHPIEVQHRGGHTSVYNSKAFELAGVTKNTPNPYGGTFDKDESGELNGRVSDNALAMLKNVGERESLSPAGKDQHVLDGVAFMSQKFVQYGLTTVHHGERGVLSAMQRQREAGKLLHRVSYEPDTEMLDAMIATGIRTGFGDDIIRVGASAEHTADGSFSERTMAMSRPFIGITPPYYGNVTENQDELNAWTERVHRAGIRVNCHANGDVAIDHVLLAYERALKLFPRNDVRPKITHCSLLNSNLIQRMKAINAVPAEFSTYAYYNSDKFHYYGEELMRNMTPFRSLIDAGIVPAAGSDFAPGPFSPMMAIQGMVTRTGWNNETWGANQRITVAEALQVNTINGAYNALEEDIKGSITPGKLADFVVLEQDLFKVEHSKIKDIKVHRTVVGGKTVYSA